jgi:hypothetical protein
LPAAVVPIGLVALLACARGGPTIPQVYPDLSGKWSGNLTIVTNIEAIGAPSVSSICIHQWTIENSTDGRIVGSWQSSPDTDIQAVAACQQSGPLTGTLSPSGAMSLSFDAILGVTGCSSTSGGDVFAGSTAGGRIAASGQDTITCPGQPTLRRTLSLSLHGA